MNRSLFPYVAAATFVFVLAVSVQAQETLPPAADVLARHVKAVGGKEALLKHKSSTMKGKIEIAGQGVGGDITAYGAAPNKVLIRFQLGGLGEIQQGYDGKVGWSINPLTGPKLLEGKELEDLRDGADYYNEAAGVEAFKSAQTVERTKFEGKECYKVKLVRKSGRELTRYYDVKTGLLAGSVSTQESQMGAIEVTTAVSDYKEFGGILAATKSVQSIAAGKFTITVTSIEYDSVDDKVFALPPQIKGLLPKQGR